MASASLLSLTADLHELELDDSVARTRGRDGGLHLVQTLVDLRAMINRLFALAAESQAFYLDIEGVNLSRHGSISIIQLWVPRDREGFLVDVHTLGPLAFATNDHEGKSFQDFLEREDIEKYWFDVRNDADALYALFNVRLAGVVDVQLLEVAARTGDRHLLRGLSACIEQDQALSGAALQEWKITKRKVVDMFDPKRGGSYEIFNIRPCPEIVMKYFMGDVRLLPVLQAKYQGRLDKAWLEMVRLESASRLAQARSAGYEHQGKHKIFAPRRWTFPSRKARKAARLSSKKKTSPAGVQTLPATPTAVAQGSELCS